LVAAFTAHSWLGEYLHNRFELPGLTPLSPENSLTALFALALFLLWWSLPEKRIPTALLLAWGLLHLIGRGVLSVIPFQAPGRRPGRGHHPGAGSGHGGGSGEQTIQVGAGLPSR
jgi:hypothetical protein